MRLWNSSSPANGSSKPLHGSQETFLSTEEEEDLYSEDKQVSDSESSYETVIVRPARKEIVKREEEIEVSDYVTDSEAEEEHRVRRENRKKKNKPTSPAKKKSVPPSAEKRTPRTVATVKKPSKPGSHEEKPKKKGWFNFSKKKKKDEEQEKAEDEPENDPNDDPYKPVERMKYTPKDYYHGFSRDHCDAAKGMKREWKHKSKERMEARKKAMEESSDSESSHEKILKRIVKKVVVLKEVEIDIPAETVRRKKEKPLKTIQVRKTRPPRRPKRVVQAKPSNITEKESDSDLDEDTLPSLSPIEKKLEIIEPVQDIETKESEKHVVDVETGKKCYMWYARLGQPNKKQFIKRIQKMLDEGKVLEIKVKDIEALPWVAGDSLLSVSKMNHLFLNPEDLSDDE